MATVKYSVIADEFMLPAVSLQEKVTLWVPSAILEFSLFQLPDEFIMLTFAAPFNE